MERLVCAIKCSILKSANNVVTRKYMKRIRFRFENNHRCYDTSYTVVLITNTFLDCCEPPSPWKNRIFNSVGYMP